MKKVRQEPPIPDPPEHLSERSKELWRTIVPLRIRSVGRVTLFRIALDCLDTADEARAAVDQQGLTTKTKTTGLMHPHPLLKIEKDSRSQFARLWKDLGLGWDRRIDAGF